MPRGISLEAFRELIAQETSDLFLFLFELTPKDTSDAETIRLVNDTVDMNFDGYNWIGCPFELSLPSDNDDDSISNAQVRVQNVDRRIVEFVRRLDAKPKARFGVVRMTYGGNKYLEIPFMNFQVTSVSYDVMEVTAQLGYEQDFLSAPATSDIFDPQMAPGLFI